MSSDTLSAILASMHLDSALISEALLTRPWGVRTEGAPGTIFHAVTRGEAWFQRAEDAPVLLREGDIVLITRGDRHTLGDEPSAPRVPIRSLPHRRDTAVPVLEYGGGGAETHILCGVFRLGLPSRDALEALLPPSLIVRPRTPHVARWLEATLALIHAELETPTPGADIVLRRLTDVLLVHVLRAWVSTLPPDARGWLAATRHPQIGQALVLIHVDACHDLTAELVAARVGMSRSAFFAKFTELVGEPPARYILRFRIHRAARRLLVTDHSVAQLADEVGYSSEDAFAKAFKRVMGLSPAAFRRQHVELEAAQRELLH